MNCSQVTANVVNSSAIISIQANATTKVVVQCLKGANIYASCEQENMHITTTQIENKPTFITSKVCTLAEFISCIANGMWLNLQPWLNRERWKN